MDLRPLPAAPLAWEQEADVVIVGTGVAGLSAALEASAAGRRVLLVGKAGLDSGSSPLAQGGLAAVLDPADSAGLHRQDTLTAGPACATTRRWRCWSRPRPARSAG